MQKRKPKAPKVVFEGNQYDKILKENAEAIFLPLVEKRLGVKIKSFRPMKDKVQTTLEREMDFFYEVETNEGEKFLLHLEFQSDDEEDMIYRGGEYHGIAMRLKKLEIRHIVIYLGTKTPTMRTQLTEKEIYRGFDLINLHALNTQTLLSSQVPDVIILAILADYEPEQAEAILRLIMRELKAVCKDPNELSKYIQQLIILSRLRKLDQITTKIAEEMPISYNIETDYLYQRGIEKGHYEKDFEFVKTLLQNTDFSEEKIASLANVSVNFVKEVKLFWVKTLLLNADFSDEKIADLVGVDITIVKEVKNRLEKEK